IILKWAQSADGYIAPAGPLRKEAPEPFWISGSASRQLVHQWRSEEGAILVGTRTALQDNPRLNARLWAGKSPLRVLIDRKLRVPGHAHLLDGSLETLVFYEGGTPPENRDKVHYRSLHADSEPMGQILNALWESGILSILVEGGAHTLNSFIKAGLWDEARIIEGASFLGAGLQAPSLSGKVVSNSNLESDRIQIIRND
ncbi:MAG: RibD family protein, partial [Robiginitalea sp.]